MTGGFDTVVGLEIHVQLATRTKLFCGDPARFGDPANTHVCPVCLGLPGALPVLNRGAVELAVRAAVGLGCVVHQASVFARKHYFYPDLPKGYQITQYDRPLATGGALETDTGDGAAASVRIRRIHLEEDAGRSIHDRFPGRTAIDLNRAGVPLIEIVTEPDLRGAGHARAFLTRLKQVLEYLEVSDCDMEKGSLRVDANLSLRRPGDTDPGTRTELKNLNSFSAIERALRFEAQRQAAVLEEGGAVVEETLLWDADRGEARPARSKEASHDYRYFPDPDLPPLVVDSELVEATRAGLPELPADRERRFRDDYALPEYDASVLTATRAIADYFEAVAAAVGDAKAASNWVMTEVLAWLNQQGEPVEAYPVAPAGLAELIRAVADGSLSTSAGRTVLARMIETGRGPAEIAEEEGLAQVRDADRLAEWVDATLAEHPAEVERYRAGAVNLLGFFMGETMRRSGGAADPRRLRQLLRERLDD